MKKLWMNTVPGRDRNADIIFHFHQEVTPSQLLLVVFQFPQVPKYLRGWHNLDMKQTAVLAALLYRTK